MTNLSKPSPTAEILTIVPTQYLRTKHGEELVPRVLIVVYAEIAAATWQADLTYCVPAFVMLRAARLRGATL